MATTKMHSERRTLTSSRRDFLKYSGGAIAAASLFRGAPTFAQNEPLKIGVLAARSGVLAGVGEGGLRGVQFAAEKFNREDGIAGRKVELVIEEEADAKTTIERARKLYLRDGVEMISGVLSTGTGISFGAEVEQLRKIWMAWDGTTQKGVEETLPNPRYAFKSTDNEIEGLIGSLMAVREYKGQIETVAGLGTDFSYGRNQWTTFMSIMEKYDMDVESLTDLWVKVGTTDTTPFVAALQRAKPDLLHSSLLFADAPIFLKQAHAAGLTERTKFLFPAAGFQHTSMKKSFTPEGMIVGHNSMYFEPPNPSALLEEFVADYHEKYNDYPHFESDRAYSTMAAYKAAVEKAHDANGGKWPTTEEIVDALTTVEVESLGGPFKYREDHIPDCNFYMGFTTHDNDYDFPTLERIVVVHTSEIQKPYGADFFEWIKKKNFDKFVKS